MATFGAQGFGAEPEESVGLMGRASELAKGLKHPMPALFHLLFKVRAEPESPAAAAARVAPPAARAQTLAILVYMFGSWFSSSFVNVFVVCVLLLAFDFWTVKNVSGRLMVGLRWHSEVQDDGTTQWRFEAQEVRPARPSPRPSGRAAAAVSFVGALSRPPPRQQAAQSARLLPLLPRQENLQSTTLDIGVFWVGLLAPAVIWIFFGVGMFFRLKFDWLLLVCTALALSGLRVESAVHPG